MAEGANRHWTIRALNGRECAGHRDGEGDK